MVELTNIEKRFHRLRVLKGVDFSAPKGKTSVIIGPSGSGKSTLLRCINLLETPDAGSVRVGEKRLAFGGAKRHSHGEVLTVRGQTGMVFQAFYLFPHKTILENVTEGPVQVQRVPAREAAEYGMALLEKVGLADKKDCYPSTLSGGQQQRAAIARALAGKPEVLLFDEPTSALDPELEREVLKVIRDLVKENRTMILVTHNLLFAQEVADYVAFMEDGQIAAYGAPQDIFGGKTTPRADAFITAMLPRPEYVI